MPRNGDGSSQNGPFGEEAKNNLIHGQGDSDKLERTEKVAPLPEGKDEKGAGLPDANASGGQSAGIKKGDNVGQGN